MRYDMERVLIERPRRSSSDGAKNLKGSARARFNMGKMTRLNRGGGTKELSDYLSPLKRWLDKQVGRPWDDVLAEIKSVVTPGVIGRHLLGHVYGWVPKNQAEDRRYDYSIDGDGILRREKYRPRRYYFGEPAPARDKPYIHLTPTTQHQNIDGIWYFLIVAKIPNVKVPYTPDPKKPWNVLYQEKPMYDYNAFQKYGRYVSVVGKRQLCRKELRAAGLRNS